jgi:uncharacterized membrane protein
MLSHINDPLRFVILNIIAPTRILQSIEQPLPRSRKMTRTFLAAALALVLAGPAAAECYADYKAKRDEPLKLHYGVAQVSDGNCSPGAAEGELAPRLAGDGWTLLNVLSTFGPEGLEERKASAGAYFLRY